MDSASPTDTANVLLSATLSELEEQGFSGVSLRAVARRAGVSHAAPKYFFGDRAGLMAAAATVGFRDLARSVREAAADSRTPLAAAGDAYLDFALHRPALFDLMFRPTELDNADERLYAARRDALMALNEIVDPDAAARGVIPDATLTAWALAHGVADLARNRALDRAAPDSDASADVARRLLAAFAASVS